MRTYPRFLLSGDSALVLEVGDEVSPAINNQVRRLMHQLNQEPIQGVTESIPTYRSLMICYDPLKISFDNLKKHLEVSLQRSVDAKLPEPRRIEVPTLYGGEWGPDLQDVADANDTTAEGVIQIHSGEDYLVYMIGFTLGFPYLGELPRGIRCPRLATPRLKVPAGSVGIADRLTGIYPLESPGGWRVIGRTPMKLFDYRLDPPSTFRAGDLARFVPIDEETFENMLTRTGKDGG